MVIGGVIGGEGGKVCTQPGKGAEGRRKCTHTLKVRMIALTPDNKDSQSRLLVISAYFPYVHIKVI